MSTRGSVGGGKSASKRRSSVAPEKVEEAESSVVYLAWKVFSKEVLKDLHCLPLEDQSKKMAEVLGLMQFQEDIWTAAQLDFYMAAYSFAAEEGFSYHQTSSFLTLLHNLLLNCRDKQMSLADNVLELKQMMDGAGTTDKCPMGRFTREQAQHVLEYVMTSLFQHYHLYQYLFTVDQEEENIAMELPVPVPPDPASLVPPPLEEAVTESFYHTYISPKPVETEDIEDSTDAAAEEGQHIGEAVPHDVAGGDVDALQDIDPEELQSALQKVVSKTVASFKTEIDQKLRSSEQGHLNRLAAVEKTLS